MAHFYKKGQSYCVLRTPPELAITLEFPDSISGVAVGTKRPVLPVQIESGRHRHARRYLRHHREAARRFQVSLPKMT